MDDIIHTLHQEWNHMRRRHEQELETFGQKVNQLVHEGQFTDEDKTAFTDYIYSHDE